MWWIVFNDSVRSKKNRIPFSASKIWHSKSSSYDEKTKSSTESTNSTSLIQCTISVRNCEARLEPYIPTYKRGWCGEFFKIKIRNPSAVVVDLPHNSLRIFLHWGRMNFWLTVLTGVPFWLKPFWLKLSRFGSFCWFRGCRVQDTGCVSNGKQIRLFVAVGIN